MSLWFTSDLHFGHSNIARLAGRPFAHDIGGVAAMNRALIDGWNDRVGPTDEVWVLGDVAMGRISETLPMVQQLHGTKILVAGNHDRCWHGHELSDQRQTRWDGEYRAAGFSRIVGAAHVELPGATHTVAVHHFPHSGDSQIEDRHGAHRPEDRGGWLLHGHVHEIWRQRGRQINVGVDAWAGAPVAAEILAGLIAVGPRDLSPLPWL